MTIANIRINAIAKRLANGIASLALLGTMSNTAFAITAQDRAACAGPHCEIVAAAHVSYGQRGTLTITDVKGRTWTLARFEGKPAKEISFPRDWSNGDEVATAYERYLAALEQGDGPAVRTSTDGRYHLCVRDGAVTCIYVPAR